MKLLAYSAAWLTAGALVIAAAGVVLIVAIIALVVWSLPDWLINAIIPIETDEENED